MDRATKAYFNKKYGQKSLPRVTDPYRKGEKVYPSAKLGPPKSQPETESNSIKTTISQKYTIAPAYNKGAYQVISPENIKDIGT